MLEAYCVEWDWPEGRPRALVRCATPELARQLKDDLFTGRVDGRTLVVSGAGLIQLAVAARWPGSIQESIQDYLGTLLGRGRERAPQDRIAQEEAAVALKEGLADWGRYQRGGVRERA